MNPRFHNLTRCSFRTKPLDLTSSIVDGKFAASAFAIVGGRPRGTATRTPARPMRPPGEKRWFWWATGMKGISYVSPAFG